MNTDTLSLENFDLKVAKDQLGDIGEIIFRLRSKGCKIVKFDASNPDARFIPADGAKIYVSCSQGCNRSQILLHELKQYFSHNCTFADCHGGNSGFDPYLPEQHLRDYFLCASPSQEMDREFPEYFRAFGHARYSLFGQSPELLTEIRSDPSNFATLKRLRDMFSLNYFHVENLAHQNVFISFGMGAHAIAYRLDEVNRALDNTVLVLMDYSDVVAHPEHPSLSPHSLEAYRAAAELFAQHFRPVIGVHPGKFHLDDALSVAMLRMLDRFHGARVVRTSDEAVLAQCTVVADVGMVYDHAQLRYDHHARTFHETFEGSDVKMAASGLIYRHYGHALIDKQHPGLSAADRDLVYNALYESFVKTVDAGDNGDERVKAEITDNTTLAARVGHLNTAWNEKLTPQEVLLRFEAASSLAGDEFRSALRRLVTIWLPSDRIVRDAWDMRHQYDKQGRLLVFESASVSSEATLFRLEAGCAQVLYVISEDKGRGTWNAKAVPKQRGGFDNRLPFPPAWRGLRGGELEQAASIPGAQFVHVSGFLGVHATFEGVLAMARASMELQMPNQTE
eukprot:gnl/Trimastix_PCT/2282.p1 GENE.gnl/Trimastix_PCT/2282~~gnl/Trimastix_PCT/2282.p1  ORF type:complete len:578 (+),score=180.14 gnl/Trimastix_PCT/2282:44-1735(+)